MTSEKSNQSQENKATGNVLAQQLHPFLPAPSSAVQRWTGEAAGSRDIVKEAHDEAIANLKDKFRGKDEVLTWLDKSNTIEEVRDEIQQLEQKYKDEVKFEKARNGLRKFSSVVLHYGTALDMITQQTPQYVSLVWGSIKFFLTAVMNHAKHVAEYTDALVHIGNLLPRAQLNAELYQNNYVKEAVARLYEQILVFFRPAIKWYSSSLQRAMTAIVSPFESGLKDTVAKIQTCATIMDAAARSSMQIELRKTYDIVSCQLPNLHSWQGDMSAGVSEIRQDQKGSRSPSFLRDTGAVTERRAGDIQARVRGIEFRTELEALKPRVLPSKALIGQRSVSRATRPWTMQAQDIVTLIKSISDWMESPDSTLLVVDAMRAKEIASELIGGVLQPKVKWICWYLPDRDEPFTVAGVLSSLVWQLYELDPAKVAGCLNGNLNRTDEDQMTEILRLILVQLSSCYVVIDAGDAGQSVDNTSQLERLNDRLQDIIDRTSVENCLVKALLFGSGISLQPAKPSVASTKSSRKIISLRPPAPIPVSRQRPGARHFFQDPGWLSLQRRVAKEP
ncbi:hypothetical protein M406DRAFT_68578 [Cryphonectria parasitica EP155]|uniref:DUF7708 domain-containing protein n=1 Tax=Cryphonectria parasitica (strain ATCC 38755 / EP155) TaxID=660469 RepID=A0A9P4Y400_CRYP1|nr:uncharacterized protein M406DRAFT_68578 [Cryphonectria parasitica EP155]KAF3766216.1 hypothetical protein M406DRAFT_68578 [Cryphonectria parasitica EP155]